MNLKHIKNSLKNLLKKNLISIKLIMIYIVFDRMISIKATQVLVVTAAPNLRRGRSTTCFRPLRAVHFSH